MSNVTQLKERLGQSRRYVVQDVMNQRALEKKKQLELELENQLASAEELILAQEPYVEGLALFIHEKRYNYKFLAVEKIRMTLQLLGSIVGAVYFLVGYMDLWGMDWIDGTFVCLGMSEPDYGTDVLGMQTSAVQSEDGSWTINGRKMWITNGIIDDEGTPADVVWLYARTGTDDRGRAELTTFLVEKGMAGFSAGQKITDKLGMRASTTAELVFEDCVVPPENVVGEPGESMIHLMRNLEHERVGLAAMSVGIARRCLADMNSYATEREAFGKQIRDFGQIQRHIGESWAEYRAMRAYVYDTARQIELSEAGHRLDSDGVKLFATTAAKNIADRAIQVMGGYGYVGEYVVERMWRDAKLLEIGGGTLESHQKNITKDLKRDPSAIGD